MSKAQRELVNLPILAETPPSELAMQKPSAPLRSNPIRALWQRFRRPAGTLKKIGLLIRGCNLACPMCSMNVNNKDVPQILRDYPGASRGGELSLADLLPADSAVDSVPATPLRSSDKTIG